MNGMPGFDGRNLINERAFFGTPKSARDCGETEPQIQVLSSKG